MIYQSFAKDNIRYAERKRKEPKGMNDKDDKDDKDGKDDKDDKNNKDGSSAKPTNTSSKKNNNFKKKEKIYSAEYEKKEKERVKFRNKKNYQLCCFMR